MQSPLCKYDDTVPDKKEVRRGLPKDREFECTRRQMPQVQAQVIKELLSAMVTVLPIMGQWRKRLCDLDGSSTWIGQPRYSFDIEITPADQYVMTTGPQDCPLAIKFKVMAPCCPLCGCNRLMTLAENDGAALRETGPGVYTCTLLADGTTMDVNFLA